MRNLYRVYGDPVPYTAPKISSRGGRVRTYSPSKYTEWKIMVAQVVRGSLDYDGSMAGAVCLGLRFYLHRPKSVKDALCCKKPDLDNLCKGVIDAIKDKLLINDDNQIIELIASKEYESKENAPGVIIKVYEWKDLQIADNPGFPFKDN
jgi:Holliday junction resolvase RusA-like endonuclease